MIAQFALRLVCGISLVWLLLPRDRITTGFFRIQMLVALGLSVLAALTIGGVADLSSTTDSLLPIGLARVCCGVLAALACLGSVVWTLGRRRAGSFFVYGVAVLSTGLLLVESVPRDLIGTWLGALWAVSELATSFLIGSATGGMLLGHWYLTAPTMSIDPLSRATVCFGSAAGFRLLASLAGLVIGWHSLNGTMPLLWLSLRWIAGIGGPIVLALMIWRILRFRNTQAATGVLFVGVIVTFIGELSATLVSRELHIPL